MPPGRQQLRHLDLGGLLGLGLLQILGEIGYLLLQRRPARWLGSSGRMKGPGLKSGLLLKLRWNHRAISRATFSASRPSR